MKTHLILLLISMTTAHWCLAQSDTILNRYMLKEISEKPDKSGRLVLDLFSDVWQGQTGEAQARNLHPGAAVGLMKVKKLNEHVHFAFGLGIASHNYHSNAIPLADSLHRTTFIPLDSVYAGHIQYKKNKSSFTYVDLPIEFRVLAGKNRKNQIMLAIGARLGVLVNAHFKYKGDALPDLFETTKFKNHTISGTSPIRYGMTGRLSYGLFCLSVYYALSPVFEENQGPGLQPISVGITVMPW